VSKHYDNQNDIIILYYIYIVYCCLVSLSCILPSCIKLSVEAGPTRVAGGELYPLDIRYQIAFGLVGTAQIRTGVMHTHTHTNTNTHTHTQTHTLQPFAKRASKAACDTSMGMPGYTSREEEFNILFLVSSSWSAERRFSVFLLKMSSLLIKSFFLPFKYTACKALGGCNCV